MASTDTARRQLRRSGPRYPRRFARCGMGVDRAEVSGSTRRRPPADNLFAQGDGCHLGYRVERLCLADAAQMLSGDLDIARLFLRLLVARQQAGREAGQRL